MNYYQHYIPTIQSLKAAQGEYNEQNKTRKISVNQKVRG